MLSKPLQFPEDTRPPWRQKFDRWYIDSFLYEMFKPFRELKYLYKRSKRLYHWSKFMWTNWDFDALSIYPLLEYKLKRVQYCLEHGYAIQDKKDMKALRICIKLANRLSNDYHVHKMYDRHDKKWGNPSRWTTPCKDGYIFHSQRPGAVFEKDKEQEKKEYLKMILEDIDRWTQRDEKLLFTIMQKHLRAWWD